LKYYNKYTHNNYKYYVLRTTGELQSWINDTPPTSILLETLDNIETLEKI